MKRTPLVAANWKMHKSIADAIDFIEALQTDIENIQGVDVLICPPFTALASLSEKILSGRIMLGAQDMHWEEKGAYTGEISASMLSEICQFVIIGHSERRALFGETDEIVHKKLTAAFSEDLRPVLCVGESLELREAGKTDSFVAGQIRAALDGFTSTQLEKMVIAYEPIWAIGTGKAATPDDAATVINETIRSTLHDLFGTEEAEAMRILYGGSVKPENARSFFQVEGIDGALVGGASLEAGSFSLIIRAAL